MGEVGEISQEVTTKNKTPLTEIQPIQRTQDDIISRRDDLEDVVEVPLLPACLELYDKNIRTVTSSANRQDLESGNAVIGIDFSTLSQANKETALKIAEVVEAGEGRQLAYIRVPLVQTDTVESVQEKTKEIVDKFKKQKMRWALSYTPEQMKKLMFLPDDYQVTPEEIATTTGMYYSPEHNRFYRSEEQCNKANEEVEE